VVGCLGMVGCCWEVCGMMCSAPSLNQTLSAAVSGFSQLHNPCLINEKSLHCSWDPCFSMSDGVYTYLGCISGLDSLYCVYRGFRKLRLL